ncbi:hypothetical protein ACW9HQ_41775, partial [Nocardia gipuzkoensis]
AVDPDIAATQAEGARRNRLGVEHIVTRVRAAGVEVAPRAVDVAVALMSQGVHDSLVVDAGWSYDEYEKWLTAMLLDAVVAGGGR